MEKEGLHCCMEFLQGHNLTVDVLGGINKSINGYGRHIQISNTITIHGM